MAQGERITDRTSSAHAEGKTKILLIDDDEDFTRIVAKFLSKEGFAVTAENSGEAGIRRAGEWTPDLILCDLAMPGLDGYEVLTRLRHDARVGDVPVIFLTGQSQPEDVRTGMNLGADDYLTKPVDSHELLRAVHARLARASTGRQQREKQMEQAMQLFAGVVHDLRDPLFVVLGYTDLLRKGAEPVQAETAAGPILDRMQQAIVRMQTIVSETLFLAKSRMQRLPFDPGAFDLRVFCEQVVADQGQGDRLRFECAEGACPVVGDALRLRQALENLLANALKYSDQPVTVTLAAELGRYQIEVRDRGIGIPAEEQGRVFDPFFRASNVGNKSGHGLGLSIVKTCVEQHGGHVTLRSAVNQGTTFTLEIPSVPPTVATSGALAPEGGAAPASPLAPSGLAFGSLHFPSPPPTVNATSAGGEKPGALKAILVDDDPLVRGVLRDWLSNTGEVTVIGEAGSLAQARELLQQHAPDAVLLDIHLPDGRGFDLLPDLGPGVAVVFVTSAEEYAVNAFDAEAVDYLLKPVSPERLQKTLQRLRQRPVPKEEPATSSGSGLGLDDSFLVKTMSEKKLIKVRDVKSVIAYGEYSWVYWDKGKGALLRKPLKQWEVELPADRFVRIHRNSIINLAFMERLERLPGGRMQVHLRETAEPIAVSLRLAPALNRKLKAFQP
jgi:two-component system sensor histidine kinase/response regulator